MPDSLEPETQPSTAHWRARLIDAVTRVHWAWLALGVGLVLALGALWGAGESEGSVDGAAPADETKQVVGADVGCRHDGECTVSAACMRAVCGDDGQCRSEPTLTLKCRPHIEVTSPKRGAMLVGTWGATVTVAGRLRTAATSAAGPSLTLNGLPVLVGADGRFSAELMPHAGGNTIELVASDARGWTRRRVQSFLWSTRYDHAGPTDTAPQAAIVVRLDEVAVDALGSAVTRVADAVDLAPFIDTEQSIVSQAGYEVTMKDLDKDHVTVDLAPIDDGVKFDAAIVGVAGELDFDCSGTACLLLGGDDTGEFGVKDVRVKGNLLLKVGERGGIEVELENLETKVGRLSLSSRGVWTDFLLGLARSRIAERAVSITESEIASGLRGAMRPGRPAITVGLQRSVTVPTFDVDAGSPTAASNDVSLALLLTRLDLHGEPNAAAQARLSASVSYPGGPSDPALHPGTDLGVPSTAGCKSAAKPLGLTPGAALQVAVTDNLLNHVLHAAWHDGLLRFALPGGRGNVTGLLPPTLSDCGAEGLAVHLGGLKVETDRFVAHVALALSVEMVANDQGVTAGVVGVAWIKTELSATHEEDVPMEPAMAQALERSLTEHLLRRTAPHGLASLRWPNLDASTVLGMPPETAKLSLSVEGSSRAAGATIVAAQLSD